MIRYLFLLLFLFLNSGCTSTSNKELISQLKTENESLKNVLSTNKQISTFLTFQDNNAEEAMNFYVSLFEDSKINDIQRYKKDGPAKEGTIFVASFELNGSHYKCSDSYIKHEWGFTPGVSNFVDCKTEKELKHLFEKLSEKGHVMMPLNNYGFSQQFGFVQDRFGISWQLNLK